MREKTRAAAHEKLKGALQEAGAHGISGLAELDPGASERLRKEGAMRALFVEACSVQEFEVLLNLKQATILSQTEVLLQAIKEDNLQEIRTILDSGGVDLMQRDARGTVPLHYAVSLPTYNFLKLREGEAVTVENREGRTAAEVLLERSLGDDVAVEICKQPEEFKILLRLDGAGISQCMRAEGAKRAAMEEHFSPWEFMVRLLADVDSLPESLQQVKPEGLWPEVLAVHLFGEPEVWRDGQHTDRSKERLGVVGACLLQLTRRVLDRSADPQASDKAMNAAGKLLKATKGPIWNPDCREPYREQLTEEMTRLSMQSEVLLNRRHAKARGAAAEWSQSFPDGEAFDQKDPYNLLEVDEDQEVVKLSKLRMAYDRKDQRATLPVPNWVTGDDIDLDVVLRDLTSVGGLPRNNDAAFPMLNLRYGFEKDLFPPELAALCDPTIVYWSTLWVRGVCHQHQHVVANQVIDILSALDSPIVVANSASDLNANLFCRTEAKAVPRICSKILEELRDLAAIAPQGTGEDGEPPPPPPQALKRLMAQAASFVLDYNGVTFVAQDMDELRKAYELLRGDPCGVIRVKNGYHKSAPEYSGYRDIKIWIPVPTEKFGELVVEVVLVTKESFLEKHWMHLPYEYFRGDYDLKKPSKPSAEFRKQVQAEAEQKAKQEAEQTLRAEAVSSLQSLWAFPREDEEEALVAALQGLWANRRDSAETFTVSGLDMVRARGAEARTLDLQWNAELRRLEWGAGKYVLKLPTVLPCFNIVWQSSDDSGRSFTWRRLRSRHSPAPPPPYSEHSDADEQEVVPDPFAELGAYRSGALDSDELVELLKAGRPDADERDVDALLAIAARDDQGRIRFSELLDFVRELRPGPQPEEEN